MSILKSKKFHLCLGFGVSLLLMAYFVAKLDWSRVLVEMQRVSLLAFLPAILLFAIHNALRAVRWRYFLPLGRAVKFWPLFDSLMVGAFATFVLPLRAGEFIRPFVLSRKSDVSFPVGFVSVVIERFFDLAAVLVSFGALAFLLPNMRREAYQGAAALGVVAAIILIVIFLGAFFPKLLRVLAGFSVRFLPGGVQAALLKFLDQFLEGTSVLRNPVNLVLAVLFTALVWGSNYLVYYGYLYLVSVEPTMLLAVTVAVLLALVVAAPSMPGFIGVYQLGCVWGFELFGYSEELGFTFAVVTHFFQYVFVVGYGGFVMLRDGMRFADMRQTT